MFVYKFICFKFTVGILAFREKGEENEHKRRFTLDDETFTHEKG